MKKLIALMMALTLVLSLAACGSKQEETPVEETPVVEEAPEVTPEETPEEEAPVEETPEETPEEETPVEETPEVTPEEETPEVTPEEEAPVEQTPEEIPEENPEVETEAPAAASNSALEILNAVWANYGDDEKFAIFGGNMESAVMDAPGVFDMAYAEALTYNLLVPADQIPNVAEAASMIHMMNANTFTCGVFRLADGVAAADFAAAMEQAVMNNMWMCGFPETLLIQDIDGAHVLVAFGLNDAMTPFAGHLAAAWPAAVTLYNQPIA